MKDKVNYPSDYFDAMYDKSWLCSDMAKYIIKTVDKSDYVSGEYIESPVFGGISPRDLSTGCKALLILLNEPDNIVSGDRMGDNCIPVLLKMATEHDYTITLSRIIDFTGYENFIMRNARTGKLITTPVEFLKEYVSEEKVQLE
mgnify:FL=1